MTAVILICAQATLADCTAATAVDVMRTPIETASPVTCFVQAQAFLAQMQFGRDLAGGAGVKIACRPMRAFGGKNPR